MLPASWGFIDDLRRPWHYRGGQRIRPAAQIMADFSKDRYRCGAGPGIIDLFDFVAAGNRIYINALGHLVTAAPNEPRSGHHQWDPAKGQSGCRLGYFWSLRLLRGSRIRMGAKAC